MIDCHSLMDSLSDSALQATNIGFGTVLLLMKCQTVLLGRQGSMNAKERSDYATNEPSWLKAVDTSSKTC